MASGTGSWNGLSWGAGTGLRIESLSGWDDLPSLRVGDVDRPLEDGEFPGQDLLKGRTVQATFLLDGTQPGGPGVAATQALLEAAMVPGAVTRTLQITKTGGSPRQAGARLRRRAIPDGGELADQLQAVMVEWFCPDPRKYSTVLRAVTIGLPVVSGGLSWPLSWPLSWGSATSGGVNAQNGGNASTRPLVRIDGPITTPALTHVEQGRTVRLDLNIASGGWVDLDFDARTVLLNGTASRYGSLVAAQWWRLDPGSNTILFAAAAGTGTATLTYRDADL